MLKSTFKNCLLSNFHRKQSSLKIKQHAFKCVLRKKSSNVVKLKRDRCLISSSQVSDPLLTYASKSTQDLLQTKYSTIRMKSDRLS